MKNEAKALLALAYWLNGDRTAAQAIIDTNPEIVGLTRWYGVCVVDLTPEQKQQQEIFKYKTRNDDAVHVWTQAVRRYN